MWTIIANLLSQNNKDAQAQQAAGMQRQQGINAHVQQNRAAADQVKNQNVSGNYGKFDINNLIGGVFTSKNARDVSAGSGTDWSRYAQ